MKKLLLVDGNSMLFRAYYATAYGHPMTSSKGIPTNAVYGFAMMIQKAIDLIQPDCMLVAFDAGKHTFRHDIYPEYKGGRKPVPDDLVPQFGMARDYLDGYHIRWLEMADIEADDLIGTMAAKSPEYATSILTSDHDLLQLIDSTTHVLLMKKGITDMEIMDEQKLADTMGIVPDQIRDLKGLMGDSSDNIPGIPGVGEKTALKLLSEYHQVENLLDHAQELKGALKQKVEAGHDSALLSKQLATIKKDVPLDIDAASCEFSPDYSTLISFLKSVDMNSLVKRYEELAAAAVKPETEAPAENAAAQPAGDRRAERCPAEFLQEPCAVYLDSDEGMFLQARIQGIALCTGEDAVYLDWEDACRDEGLQKFLAAEGTKIGFDVKRDLHLLNGSGMAIRFSDDAMILAALADSTLTDTDKIMEHFGLADTITREQVYGKPQKPVLVDPDLQTRFGCMRARNLLKLYSQTLPMIQEYGMLDLYRNVELPLSGILCGMEAEGIRTDIRILDRISEETMAKIQAEQSAIYEEAGGEFNINSPKQLAEILFDKLQLPGGKKRSTSADVLAKLAGFHPIIDHLLAYRKLSKLYGTYSEGLKKFICPDGRIHTVYNQCATQTGRLSSSDPNLQNISVRDEQGKEIRKAFLPSPGCVLISSDYSQIELRMLAHMADETNLIAAFNSNIDIHTKTAMDIFEVSREDVTPLMRRQAKMVNFGIVYGISDFGLAERLGIGRKEAGDFIDTYYRKYPKIRTYMEGIVASCEEKGYVSTLLGRRRDIPEIHDKNRMVREFGKRAAMNAPIQGSAADLIKLAMIRIDRAMQTQKVKSKMILQVHDELIFDVPQAEIETMKRLIQDGMENAMQLKVPLKAETAVGNDWYEAK